MENVDLTVLKPEDATLLRAVPVTSVLRGSLFNKKSNHFVPAEHGGPHPSLRHSVQVAGNAAFSVSYCPDVCKTLPRSGAWRSQLALLEYVNGRAAILASVVVAAIFFAIQVYTGPLGYPQCVRSGFGESTEACWLLHGPLLGAHRWAPLAYFLTLLFWHRVPLVGSGGTLCFFDKLVQAQHGPDRERVLGMQPVFSRHSDRLCVLRAPGYFERLSTLFDLASFVHCKTRTLSVDEAWERVDFQGLATPLVVPVGQLMNITCGWLAYDLAGLSGGNAYFYVLVNERFELLYCLVGAAVGATTGLFMLFIQVELEDLHTAVRELSSFELAGARLFGNGPGAASPLAQARTPRHLLRWASPRDRKRAEQIEGAIAAWYGESEEDALGDEDALISNATASKVHAATDKGLENFERHVRVEFREQILRKLFPTGESLFSYHKQVLWSMPTFWRMLDFLAAYLTLGATGNGTDAPGSPILTQYVIFMAALAMLAQPMCFVLIRKAVKWCGVDHRSGWGRWLSAYALSVIFCALTYGSCAYVFVLPGGCSPSTPAVPAWVGMWGKASPPEAVSCATTCTTTYWCLVGAYVIVGILMQVGNVNWARWVRPGAGSQPKVHVE